MKCKAGIRIFFFLKINLFVLFIYFWLCWVFVAASGLSLVAASRGHSLLWWQASHCSGLSRCGAWALGTRAQELWLTGSRAQAQQLWCTGSVALQHVGSSQTRARTRVPCIGRQILNHCATREAQGSESSACTHL